MEDSTPEQKPIIEDSAIEKKYQEFWKPIIENPDGTINLEQLKKELADFSVCMSEVPKVYCHITGNRLSYVNYPAATVISVADEYHDKFYEDHYKEQYIIGIMHPDYDFINDDKVFVENSDGTTDYFLLTYDPEVAAWSMIPFTDKTFTTTKEVDGKIKGEFFYSYGYDVVQRVEDFDFEELP